MIDSSSNTLYTLYYIWIEPHTNCINAGKEEREEERVSGLDFVGSRLPEFLFMAKESEVERMYNSSGWSQDGGGVSSHKRDCWEGVINIAREIRVCVGVHMHVWTLVLVLLCHTEMRVNSDIKGLRPKALYLLSWWIKCSGLHGVTRLFRVRNTWQLIGFKIS